MRSGVVSGLLMASVECPLSGAADRQVRVASGR